MVEFETKLMKRYFVFAYYQYYPLGGIEDIRGSSETLEEALEIYKSCKANNYDHCYLYYFTDAGDFEIVESEETDLYG